MPIDFEQSRFLITGGAGLIGSHIADALVARRAREVVVLDNLSRGRTENLAHAMEHGKVTLVDGDVRDTRLVHEVVGSVDYVFHQAAIRITQCAAEPRLCLEVLVNGTFNVLEACVAAKTRKLVAASSASVYGMATAFPTDETHHPYNNRTLYGAAKVANEQMFRAFHDMYGLPYVALRYFNVYGPRMDIFGAYTEVLIRWMERVMEGEPPLIFGDGSQTMDFIYVEDVARANILAAEGDVTDEVFNVASGVETSLQELSRALLGVMHADLGTQYGSERKVNPVPRRLADTRKAAALLGFRARVSLEEGLRRLVEWWRHQRSTA